ncbi:MAG: Uma2 family endonuclease [Acidimicrobiales bacterium]
MTEAVSTLSFEEFLAGEQAGGTRHEWVGGFTYSMAGGTERHDTMVETLRDILGPGARRAGCRRFTGNRMVRTVSAAYYPDLLIVCGKAADVHYETDAALIVEVRSPSTADVDRREKAVAYASLPSVNQYLLVDPYYRRIDVGTRSQAGWQWVTFGPGSVVITPYGDIELDSLYDEVDAASSIP